MQEGQEWDNLPQDLVVDLAQLTKANSIEGNKKDNITVIYTPWSNLKKDGSMEVGQVTFKDTRKVRYAAGRWEAKWKRSWWQWTEPDCQQVKRILVPQRENPIVNRLNKTKIEKKPDFKQEKDDRLKELRQRDQAFRQQKVRGRPLLPDYHRAPTLASIIA